MDHPSVSCENCLADIDCEECPLYLPVNLSFIAELHSQMRFTHQLPCAGGLLDQPIKLMKMIMIIENTIREQEGKELEKQRKLEKRSELLAKARSRYGR